MVKPTKERKTNPQKSSMRAGTLATCKVIGKEGPTIKININATKRESSN